MMLSVCGHSASYVLMHVAIVKPPVVNTQRNTLNAKPVQMPAQNVLRNAIRYNSTEIVQDGFGGARTFQKARDWFAQFTSPLRTLDGLHLAIAWTNGLTLLTADSLLAQ